MLCLADRGLQRARRQKLEKRLLFLEDEEAQQTTVSRANKRYVMSLELLIHHHQSRES